MIGVEKRSTPIRVVHVSDEARMTFSPSPSRLASSTSMLQVRER